MSETRTPKRPSRNRLATLLGCGAMVWATSGLCQAGELDLAIEELNLVTSLRCASQTGIKTDLGNISNHVISTGAAAKPRSPLQGFWGTLTPHANIGSIIPTETPFVPKSDGIQNAFGGQITYTGGANLSTMLGWQPISLDLCAGNIVYPFAGAAGTSFRSTEATLPLGGFSLALKETSYPDRDLQMQSIALNRDFGVCNGFDITTRYALEQKNSPEEQSRGHIVTLGARWKIGTNIHFSVQSSAEIYETQQAPSKGLWLQLDFNY